VAEKFGMDPVKATARGGITLLVMSLACLISYPIIGILLDRWGRIQIVLLGLLMSGVGLCIMAATQNPFTPGMFLYVSLVGIGFSAANVGANTLAADSSPMPLLGSILGGLNTMQPIGILFFLQLGGLLLDQVGYWAPFALKGIGSLICCLYILSVRKGIVVQKHEGMPPHGMPNK